LRGKEEDKSKYYDEENLIPQDLDIDGENLEFKKFVSYECKKHEIELILDFEHILETSYLR